jgi:hypothetical protein
MSFQSLAWAATQSSVHRGARALNAARTKYADLRILEKWNSDIAVLPLVEGHRELYFNIHRTYWTVFHQFPDIVSCKTYNDRMQWLKLFDQRCDTITCSDKLLIRSYIEKRLGADRSVNILATYNDAALIDFDQLPNQFVIKPNHDSGTTCVVRDKRSAELQRIKEKMIVSCATRFGWDRGEWAYSFVQPRVLVEELIDLGDNTAPPDYKFMCVNGEVRFVHFLYDRATQLKEQTIDPQGVDMRMPFYTAIPYGDRFTPPDNWGEMLFIARELSAGWKFVRVDLYSAHSKIYVGEMTFWPGAGLYPMGKNQDDIGSLLDFDTTTFMPEIVSDFNSFQSN